MLFLNVKIKNTVYHISVSAGRIKGSNLSIWGKPVHPVMLFSNSGLPFKADVLAFIFSLVANCIRSNKKSNCSITLYYRDLSGVLTSYCEASCWCSITKWCWAELTDWSWRQTPTKRTENTVFRNFLPSWLITAVSKSLRTFWMVLVFSNRWISHLQKFTDMVPFKRWGFSST